MSARNTIFCCKSGIRAPTQGAKLPSIDESEVEDSALLAKKTNGPRKSGIRQRADYGKTRADIKRQNSSDYSSDEDNADSNKVDLTELDNGNKSCEAVAKAAGCTFVPSDKAQKEWERYCEKMKL